MDIQPGIDITEIKRFKKAYKKYKGRFLNKIFSEEEMKYLKGDILKMCISFSFKESIWKALPQQLQKKYHFKKIKIIWNGSENPLLLFERNYKFSLSYLISKKYVITIAFLFRN